MTSKFQWMASTNHQLFPLTWHVGCRLAMAALELISSPIPFHSGTQTEEESPTWDILFLWQRDKKRPRGNKHSYLKFSMFSPDLAKENNRKGRIPQTMKLMENSEQRNRMGTPIKDHCLTQGGFSQCFPKFPNCFGCVIPLGFQFSQDQETFSACFWAGDTNWKRIKDLLISGTIYNVFVPSSCYFCQYKFLKNRVFLKTVLNTVIFISNYYPHNSFWM